MVKTWQLFELYTLLAGLNDSTKFVQKYTRGRIWGARSERMQGLFEVQPLNQGK